jgi:hypothetical protein
LLPRITGKFSTICLALIRVAPFGWPNIFPTCAYQLGTHIQRDWPPYSTCECASRFSIYRKLMSINIIVIYWSFQRLTWAKSSKSGTDQRGSLRNL